ncbi:hypothetical protein BDV12DRAFT_200084 [Aspergillus spectabilis]
MALLKGNAVYERYLREVAAGDLVLPEYQQDEEGFCILYYGEVFCRAEDCDKSKIPWSNHNNLRSHIVRHDSLDLVEKEKGRPGMAVVDKAKVFYRSLFEAGDASKAAEKEACKKAPKAAKTPCLLAAASPSEQSVTTSDLSDAPDNPLPMIPLNKKGSAHITNMRLEVKSMGHPIPCSSCGTAKECCKNYATCKNFLHFDCSAMEVEAEDKSN